MRLWGCKLERCDWRQPVTILREHTPIDTIPFNMIHINRIGGSVVEFSPATRAAGVRFPADVPFFYLDTYIFSSDQ
jgi:hypothetical protein